MPSADKVGYAVVGLGAIAQACVLPAFGHSKHARLVALVSLDKNKSRQLAQKYKAESAYGSNEYDDCLSHPQVSAVYIATPNGEHASYAIRAANRGKHVLCEKPLAATVAQSRRMIKAHRTNGTLLMTAYRKYFEPSCRYIKRLIKSGELGQIDVIHTAFSELHRPGVSPAWLLDRKLAGGGPLMDLGIYCINTSRWLIDEDPVRATAVSWRHNRVKFRNIEEGVQFRLEFPGGTIVQASATYSAAPSSFLSIQGKKGWVVLAPAFPYDEQRRLTGKIGSCRIDKKFPVIDEFAPELDAFALAIRRGNSPEPDGEQGHRDMLIMKAIYQSANDQKPVEIRYK